MRRLRMPMYSDPAPDRRLVACPDCDLLLRLPVLEDGASACCPRCDYELWRRRTGSRARCLPLALAAAVLYVLANAVPMLGLEAVGHRASTTVVGGALELWADGRELVAVLVLFTAVVAPALQIGLMLAILVGSRRAPAPRWVGTLLRHHPAAVLWSMIEVMMLGVLVALIKIADYATVVPGPALWMLAVLVVLLAAMQSLFDPREVWARVGWAADGATDAAAPDTAEARP